MKVRTRFAPSPTGFIHIGNVYSALFSYAFAKRHGGDFILRIEDTDKKRYVAGAEKVVYQGLAWLGLTPDEGPEQGGPFGPYRQSERLTLYRQAAEELIKKGHAYYCFCSQKRLEEVRKKAQRERKQPMYDRCCRSIGLSEARRRVERGEKAVIRMKIPDNEKIVVDDLIRGRIVFDSSLIDDQVLLKADGFPTYHLAVVVDDHLMKISHVIRGEGWLSSTPKHILLYRWFGWQAPVFFHNPILRNPDRSKMGKRKGATSLSWYREEGFLPEALLNFLALLGWSHPEEKEIFSLDEFINHFDLKDVDPVGPVFDLRKLEWMNGVYIRQKTSQELARLLKPFLPQVKADQLLKLAPLIKERIKRLSQAKELAGFLWSSPACNREDLIQKEADRKKVKGMLEGAKRIIKEIGVEKSKEVQEALFQLIEKNGWKMGDFFMVLRVAVCGRRITPPIVESLSLIGKEETVKRLNLALKRLK